MIAFLTIPAFSLRAAVQGRPELRHQPVALAPAPGQRPLVGPCTAAAVEAGVRPGMRLSEALATCPELHLVEQDPAAVEAEWERILRRLEEAGLAVEAAEPGCAYFETRGIERLAGDVRAAVQRSLDAVGPVWGPRVGVAVSARLVGGGSWRRAATLREPTAEPERLRQALAPKFRELPAPAVELRLELGELTESVGTQAELVRPRGSRLRSRLREGLRQVRAAVGIDAVYTVVEVAPWSRIPENRAILVPRDD